MHAFSHLGDDARPGMVDVSNKPVTPRSATAEAILELPPEVRRALTGENPHTAKGSVIATAILAGTLAAKRTADFIPLCHIIPLDSVKFHHAFSGDAASLSLRCTVKATHRTGVEMEALVGASIAALTVYDMCKSLSHDIRIVDQRLLSKSGGKSGPVTPP